MFQSFLFCFFFDFFSCLPSASAACISASSSGRRSTFSDDLLFFFFLSFFRSAYSYSGDGATSFLISFFISFFISFGVSLAPSSAALASFFALYSNLLYLNFSAFLSFLDIFLSPSGFFAAAAGVLFAVLPLALPSSCFSGSPSLLASLSSRFLFLCFFFF